MFNINTGLNYFIAGNLITCLPNLRIWNDNTTGIEGNLKTSIINGVAFSALLYSATYTKTFSFMHSLVCALPIAFNLAIYENSKSKRFNSPLCNIQSIHTISRLVYKVTSCVFLVLFARERNGKETIKFAFACLTMLLLAYNNHFSKDKPKRMPPESKQLPPNTNQAPNRNFNEVRVIENSGNQIRGIGYLLITGEKLDVKS